jgi:hypothetical protein
MPITRSELNDNMFSRRIVKLGSEKRDGQGSSGEGLHTTYINSRPSPPTSLQSKSSLFAPLPSSLPLHIVPS